MIKLKWNIAVILTDLTFSDLLWKAERLEEELEELEEPEDRNKTPRPLVPILRW